MFEGQGKRLLIECANSCIRISEANIEKETAEMTTTTKVTAHNMQSQIPPPNGRVPTVTHELASNMAGDSVRNVGIHHSHNSSVIVGLQLGHHSAHQTQDSLQLVHHMAHHTTDSLHLDVLSPQRSAVSSAVSSRSPILKANDFVYTGYMNLEEEETEEISPEFTGDFDFGIYLEYWRRGRKNSVIPKYRNLRDELTQNQYSKIPLHQYRELHEECQQFLEKHKNEDFKAKDIGSSNQICKISPGTVISIEHLIAMRVYTDFTETQKKFKRHCRRLYKDDTLESIMGRNCHIANWCRLLKECVMFWGKIMAKKDVVSCGLNAKLVFRSLHQRFECPLSTSKTLHIAEQFAGGIDGVILRLQRATPRTRYFDVKSFSKFSSEEERLFMGSALKIKAIRVWNYEESKWDSLKPKNFVPALAMFEQVYNGHFIDGKAETRALLSSLIRMVVDESIPRGMFYAIFSHL